MRESVWKFETARFRVALEIEPEDMAPEESFEFEEDIAAVRNGAVEWFQALVVVYLKGKDGAERRIGWDSLGGCAYRTRAEFYEAHRDPDPMNRNCTIMRRERGGDIDAKIAICHYFPDMVSVAITDARKTLSETPRMRVA